MKETGLFIVLSGPVNELWLIIVLYINERNWFVYCTIWPVYESWLIIVLYINERNWFINCTIWACEGIMADYSIIYQ